MDTVEVKLLKYAFRFRRLSWREELSLKFPPKQDRRRVLLACALAEVSGLKVNTVEEATKVMEALPLSIVHRVFIVWRGSLETPRLFTTTGLYQAPEPNKFVKKLEQAAEERETIMDRVEKEMESKFGRKELLEAREVERQMARNSKLRGASKASPDIPLGGK